MSGARRNTAFWRRATRLGAPLRFRRIRARWFRACVRTLIEVGVRYGPPSLTWEFPMIFYRLEIYRVIRFLGASRISNGTRVRSERHGQYRNGAQLSNIITTVSRCRSIWPLTSGSKCYRDTRRPGGNETRAIDPVKSPCSRLTPCCAIWVILNGFLAAEFRPLRRCLFIYLKGVAPGGINARAPGPSRRKAYGKLRRGGAIGRLRWLLSELNLAFPHCTRL